MNSILLAYIPALHSGYIRFFEKFKGLDLLLISHQFLGKICPGVENQFIRDIRCIDAEIMKTLVESLGIFKSVSVATRDVLQKNKSLRVIMPDEDVSHMITASFSLSNAVFEKVFLRWDKMAAVTQHSPLCDRIVNEKVIQDFMNQAFLESQKSFDWWRQVGAVLVNDDRIFMMTRNEHVPGHYSLHALGDPRTNFNAGESIEISTAIHAEASIIAKAARDGVSLKGAEIYVTTFPCPNCARLLKGAGISRVYFKEGYSLLDAYDILKNASIEVVKVE